MKKMKCLIALFASVTCLTLSHVAFSAVDEGKIDYKNHEISVLNETNIPFVVSYYIGSGGNNVEIPKGRPVKVDSQTGGIWLGIHFNQIDGVPVVDKNDQLYFNTKSIYNKHEFTIRDLQSKIKDTVYYDVHATVTSKATQTQWNVGGYEQLKEYAKDIEKFRKDFIITITEISKRDISQPK